MKFQATKLLYTCLVATSFFIFQASTQASVENKHSDHKKSHHEKSHHKKIIIKSVSVEIDNSQIIINVLNMDDRSSPLVKLADEDLTIQSYTDTQIVVSLPPGILAGDYVLQVKNHKKSVSYLLTVGAVGPIGPTGAQGIQGKIGLVGNKGDKGDTGIQGAKGDTGIQGAKGDTGIQGDKGDTGLQGNTGSQGPKGDTGPQGAPAEIAGTKMDMYKCPHIGKGDIGSGQWGFYGCQGQISNRKTCITIEHPRSITSNCRYVGSVLLQP